MERKNQRISDLFYNNRFLLVFSVVAAIALWLVIAVEYGPEATKKVDVNVQANFEYVKKNFGFECFGNYDKTVEVTIRGQRVVVDSDDIVNQISAELTGSITRAGEVPLTINVKKSDESISDFEIISDNSSAYYKLYFDKKLDKEYPVIPQISCSEGENKYIPDSSAFDFETKTIKISGPATKVEKIESVVARNVDKKIIEETTEITAEILLLDINGNVINPDDNYISLSAKEIKVTIPVYHKKTMKTGYSIINRPTRYLSEQNDPFTVSFTPSYVNVAVSESMKDMDVLEVCNLDYSQIYNGVYNLPDISVDEIDGCIFLGGTEKISVEVDARNLSDKIISSPDISTVSFESVPEGKTPVPVSIDFESVRMIGPKESVEALDVNDLKITVDLGTIPEETEDQIQVRAFIETDDCWSCGGEYFVTVNIE